MRRRPHADPLEREDPNARPRVSWRDEVIGASGMNVVAGLWLMLSPWLLAYDSDDPIRNDLLIGALVTTFALLRVTGGVRGAWLSWLNLALGLWVFLTGVAFASSTVASLNEMVMGVLVALLAILSIGATDSARRGKGEPPRDG